MRRKDDTLRDTLLYCARETADREGIDAVSIRSIAQKAGVAAGTVYNYFSNKDEILLELTEEYWRQALHDMRTAAGSFCGQLEEIFAFLKERIDSSAGKLMGSLGNVETAGQERMASMQASFEKNLLERMAKDTQIRDDVWDEVFTREQFARFIVMNMTMLLKTRASDIRFLTVVIERTIY
ncbi:TetR/AcrR family transcriptional regulator [Lacrimispora sp. NSJ-141]|uniref:TetR/AcrR family transcriptional regulator n=1 Tax=Lientehia hominis TaxID=2897778 RepID=A0AAP2RKP6_9FIRM|nr:TetR/AcrR family transcriptional regulator [Lientehia hominis]MCD2493324.1 TetR/AcrR family transcriptional regulator [Lientehia hominis]